MGSISLNERHLQFLVIGAGSRGHAYACAVAASTNGSIAAVADIDQHKRQELGRKYIWGNGQPKEHQSFSSWQDWVEWETKRRNTTKESANSGNDHDEDGFKPITGAFICTLDQTHAPIIRALAPLNIHLFCEKPLALSLADCLSISSSLTRHPPKIVSIGHVLRYSPHNILLRKLLLTDQVIGEIVSIEHTEPVGWWHFSHSYVRGNWRRSTPEGVGSLLTKSGHDIDFLMWLLSSPSPLTGNKTHLPSFISSTGALTQFRKARKPKKAGNATNCLNCEAENDCIYSAQKIYRLKTFEQDKFTGWPLKIVLPEIEDIATSSGWPAAESTMREKLAEDYDRSKMSDEKIASRGWYGRCVYESDNDVVDDQTVTISWDDDPIPGHEIGRGPKTALFHMTYPTQSICERRGRIYGSAGEIEYDSQRIVVHDFATKSTSVHEIPEQPIAVQKAHGGGDWGLAGAFVKAIESVETGEMSVEEAQNTFVGCDLDEIIRSHAVVFAAEEARMNRSVVSWKDWWEKQSLKI